MSFFISGFLFLTTHVFAADYKAIIECEGSVNRDEVIPYIQVLEGKDGKLKSRVLQKGVKAGPTADPDTLIDFKMEIEKKNDQGCYLNATTKLGDKVENAKLSYADGKLVYKGTNVLFANTTCRYINKDFEKKLKECDAPENMRLGQGILCQSDEYAGKEIDIRMDMNKDFSYAEGTVYVIRSGNKSAKTEFDARSINVSAKLLPREGGSDVCSIRIKDKSSDSENAFDLEIRAATETKKNKKRVFDSGTARVEEVKIKISDKKIAQVESQFKIMRCEFMGDFYEKLQTCDFNMAEGATTKPKTQKADGASGASEAGAAAPGAK